MDALVRAIRRAREGHERDQGMSLVEVLVALVLLGTTVVSTLGAVQTSVIATRVERDHSKAFQWLQSAVGELQAIERVGCDLTAADSAYATGEQKVRERYEAAIRLATVFPVGWEPGQLTILSPVQVWDGNRYWNPASAPQPCYDSAGFELQLITIQVTSPDGRIIETIQVVKDGTN